LEVDVFDTVSGRVVEVHADWASAGVLDARLRYTVPLE